MCICICILICILICICQVRSTMSGLWQRTFQSRITEAGWLATGTSGFLGIYLFLSFYFYFISGNLSFHWGEWISQNLSFPLLLLVLTGLTQSIGIFLFSGTSWKSCQTRASITSVFQLVIGPGRLVIGPGRLVIEPGRLVIEPDSWLLDITIG